MDPNNGKYHMPAQVLLLNKMKFVAIVPTQKFTKDEQ